VKEKQMCTVSAVEYMLILNSLTKKTDPARTSMAKHKEPVSWYPIKVSVDGAEVTGVYSIDSSDWMTVRMDGGGTKSAHGGLAAEGVARLMLIELFNESHQR
jgi:hypothetical protein